MNLKILQLASGDVIVGDRVEYDKLQNVFYLSYTTIDKEQGPVLTLSPYAFFVKDNTIVLNQQNVTWSSEPSEGMIKDYNRAIENISKVVNEAAQ